MRGRAWEVPEGERRERDGTGALYDEQVSPVCQRASFDLEDAKGKETGEGRRDALSCIK